MAVGRVPQEGRARFPHQEGGVIIGATLTIKIIVVAPAGLTGGGSVVGIGQGEKGVTTMVELDLVAYHCKHFHVDTSFKVKAGTVTE